MLSPNSSPSATALWLPEIGASASGVPRTRRIQSELRKPRRRSPNCCHPRSDAIAGSFGVEQDMIVFAKQPIRASGQRRVVDRFEIVPDDRERGRKFGRPVPDDDAGKRIVVVEGLREPAFALEGGQAAFSILASRLLMSWITPVRSIVQSVLGR